MVNPSDHVDVLSEIRMLIAKDDVDETIIDDIQKLLPNKCPSISNEDLAEGVNLLQVSFSRFMLVEDPNLKSEDVDVNTRNLAELVSRVYKRMEYYRYFHNITEVSELKRTALIAFWLIKLKPFTVLCNDSPIRISPNEKFALNLILAEIQYLLEEKGKKFDFPEQCFIQDTLYAFKYRDLTKEALILFVDSIAKAYGITIDSWI